jgi:hypothetical protein
MATEEHRTGLPQLSLTFDDIARPGHSRIFFFSVPCVAPPQGARDGPGNDTARSWGASAAHPGAGPNRIFLKQVPVVRGPHGSRPCHVHPSRDAQSRARS